MPAAAWRQRRQCRGRCSAACRASVQASQHALAIHQRARRAGPNRSGAAGRTGRRTGCRPCRRRARPAASGKLETPSLSSATSSPSSSAVSTSSAADRLGDGGQPVGPVVAVAGDQPHLAVVDPGEQAIAVELDLADPVVAFWRLFDQRRVCGAWVCRQLAAFGAGGGRVLSSAGSRFTLPYFASLRACRPWPASGEGWFARSSRRRRRRVRRRRGL